jgi:hypothetical protein
MPDTRAAATTASSPPATKPTSEHIPATAHPTPAATNSIPATKPNSTASPPAHWQRVPSVPQARKLSQDQWRTETWRQAPIRSTETMGMLPEGARRDALLKWALISKHMDPRHAHGPLDWSQTITIIGERLSGRGAIEHLGRLHNLGAGELGLTLRDRKGASEIVLGCLDRAAVQKSGGSLRFETRRGMASLAQPVAW